MAKKARKAKVEITLDGKNVSGDLAPYLKSLTFDDKTSNEVDEITITLDDRDELFCDAWMPMIGDSLEVSIKCFDWDESDDEQTLYCGSFEIDLVTESGPPSIIEIKAVSLFNSDIRRTLNSKKWQKTSLKAICEEVAKLHGLKYKFVSESIKNKSGTTIAVDDDAVEIAETSQNDQSDLAFVVKLAEDNGYVVKLDDEYLTLCSQTYLETQKPLLTISKYDISGRSSGRQGFNLYKEAVARYFCPKCKKSIKKKVSHNEVINNPEWLKEHTKPRSSKAKKQSETVPTKPVSFFAKNGGSRTLIIRQKFSSIQEAERVAQAQLVKKNSGEWKISGSVMGNPFLMSGSCIEIVDYGQFDGIYYIETTTHTVSNGYKTSFVAHKAHIEGQV